jgi:hypothetical protein
MPRSCVSARVTLAKSEGTAAFASRVPVVSRRVSGVALARRAPLAAGFVVPALIPATAPLACDARWERPVSKFHSPVPAPALAARAPPEPEPVLAPPLPPWPLEPVAPPAPEWLVLVVVPSSREDGGVDDPVVPVRGAVVPVVEVEPCPP